MGDFSFSGTGVAEDRAVFPMSARVSELAFDRSVLGMDVLAGVGVSGH